MNASTAAVRAPPWKFPLLTSRPWAGDHGASHATSSFPQGLRERALYARGSRNGGQTLFIKDGKLNDFVKNRYSSYDKGIGKNIEQGKASFESLQKYILAKGDAAANGSARQEYLENLFNSYC